MYGYIYKTTNLINNKIYIGQHKSNKFEPEKYIGSGVLINKAIKKYGRKNFKCEILEECNSKEELNQKEIYWIDKLKSQYNISIGGNGGDLGEKVNNKISETAKKDWKLGIIKHHPNSGFKKGYIPWNKGKEGTFKGKKHSIETKSKISLALKGRKQSNEWCKNHSEQLKGHKVSDETRIKMSQNNCMKNPEIIKKVIINRLKNLKKKHWISNGVEVKLINADEIDIYMNNGWKIGRRKV